MTISNFAQALATFALKCPFIQLHVCNIRYHFRYNMLLRKSHMYMLDYAKALTDLVLRLSLLCLPWSLGERTWLRLVLGVDSRYTFFIVNYIYYIFT